MGPGRSRQERRDSDGSGSKWRAAAGRVSGLLQDVRTVTVQDQGGSKMIGIAAQVSLYPLGQESLSPAIEEALRIFREHGLEVQPGAMSTVITGDDQELFPALQEAFGRVAEQGHVVMVVTLSNACPVPVKND